MEICKQDVDFTNKVVLVRVDYNVPLEKSDDSYYIMDHTRIDESIPTIKEVINKKPKLIILVSHLGRPKGKINKIFSLKPVCENLEKKVKQKISLLDDNIFNLKKEDLFKNQNDQIVFLENVRFYEEEENNDTSFAKHLFPEILKEQRRKNKLHPELLKKQRW